MNYSKCRKCRRLGTKLFLKGEKCLSPKCAMIKKPYPPGQKGKRRISSLSEYGKELKEKQKLKNFYNLSEKQFRNYIEKVFQARGKVEDAETLLIRILESRLDNVVFRLGFATSRAKARQLVSHRHFLLNDKIINIPSYLVKSGDKITLKPASVKKNIFKDLSSILKKQQPPFWLELNINKLEGKVIGQASLEEAAPPVEISLIFEYYSR